MRARKFPVVGDGGGVWSHIHLEDAAAATVLALDHDGPAIYNIVDDEPAPTRVWLPELAKIVGAKPPLPPPTARPNENSAGRSATQAGAKALPGPTASRNRSTPGRDAAGPHDSR
jgi:nucleoside-diphosphate-sugar epimerase